MLGVRVMQRRAAMNGKSKSWRTRFNMERLKYSDYVGGMPSCALNGKNMDNFMALLKCDKFRELNHLCTAIDSCDGLHFFSGAKSDGTDDLVGVVVSSFPYAFVKNTSQLDKPFFFLENSRIFITDVPSFDTFPDDFALRLATLLSDEVTLIEDSVYTFDELLSILYGLDEMSKAIEINVNQYVQLEHQIKVLHMFVDNYVPKDYTNIREYIYTSSPESVIRHGFESIIGVREFGKLRVASVFDHRGNFTKMVVATQKHPVYSVLDVGRVIIDGHYLDDTITKEFMRYNGEAIHKIVSDNLPNIVGISHIQNALRIHNIAEERIRKEKEIETEYAKKFREVKDTLTHYDYLSKPTTITFDGITFNGHRITYNDLVLECTEDSVMESVYSRFDIHDSFNDIMGDCLQKIDHYIKRTNMALTIGSTKAGNLRTLQLSTKTFDHKTKYFINGIRINKSDYLEVIRNSLCFSETSAYNHYVKQISKMSLTLHKMTNDGLIYTELVDANNLPTPCKLVVVRKNKKSYIEYKTESGLIHLPIKNQIKLINHSHIKWDNITRVSVLKNTLSRALGNTVSLEMCDEIIKQGIALMYKEASEQREALEREIKQLNLERKEVMCDNVKSDAVIVTGQSNKQYVIRIADAKVWEYPNMSYVCIADTENTNMWGKVLNRVYALKNDSMMAGKISTLHV
jgi:hypothetical protein